MAAGGNIGGGVIVVRSAGLREMGTICRLEARCFGLARLFGGQWQRIGMPAVRAWTAHVQVAQDMAAVGFLIAYPLAIDGIERPYVAALGVVNAHRRRGVGRALLRHALAAFGDVWLHVRASNAPAIALYEVMGFTIAQRVGAYYRDGEDAITMRTW